MEILFIAGVARAHPLFRISHRVCSQHGLLPLHAPQPILSLDETKY